MSGALAAAGSFADFLEALRAAPRPRWAMLLQHTGLWDCSAPQGDPAGVPAPVPGSRVLTGADTQTSCSCQGRAELKCQPQEGQASLRASDSKAILVSASQGRGPTPMGRDVGKQQGDGRLPFSWPFAPGYPCLEQSAASPQGAQSRGGLRVSTGQPQVRLSDWQAPRLLLGQGTGCRLVWGCWGHADIWFRERSPTPQGLGKGCPHPRWRRDWHTLPCAKISRMLAISRDKLGCRGYGKPDAAPHAPEAGENPGSRPAAAEPGSWGSRWFFGRSTRPGLLPAPRTLR